MTGNSILPPLPAQPAVAQLTPGTQAEWQGRYLLENNPQSKVQVTVPFGADVSTTLPPKSLFAPSPPPPFPNPSAMIFSWGLVLDLLGDKFSHPPFIPPLIHASISPPFSGVWFFVDPPPPPPPPITMC